MTRLSVGKSTKFSLESLRIIVKLVVFSREFLRWSLLKFGPSIMDFHGFDTQRKRTSDLTGSLERISAINGGGRRYAIVDG